MIVNHKKLNPNAFYLLKYLNDATLRFIILYGGSSSGKSFSVAQAVLIQTLQDGENTLVMRKVGASISKTIYEDYKVAASLLGISQYFKFIQNSIKCTYNGAKIDFSGLDDPEKIKGISNYKRVQLEELSEFEYADLKQIRKRLRGKKGQQIIADFNPISETNWIKKDWLDNEKLHDVPMVVEIGGKVIPAELTKVKSLKMNEGKSMVNPKTKEIEEYPPNMVVIQSTYLNNFWVVGSPDGTYGYYDEQCVMDFEHDRLYDPDYYNVYALGEWGVIKTGNEFLNSFNVGKNSGEYPYIPGLPIHLSVDSNVLPYISVSYWQADLSKGKDMYQIAETTAESPNNSVRRAAKLVSKRLHELGYDDKIYLHGDASAKAANTIDDNKRSFMDLFIDTLKKDNWTVEDKVGNKNPSVSMTGEFVNAIFEKQLPDLSINIDDGCRASIDDYQSVQKDVNGAILKTKVKDSVTKQTYEVHGHLTDTLRYVVHDIMYEEYVQFSNRRKRNMYSEKGMFSFFNPELKYKYRSSIVYVMPNVEGKFYMCHAGECGDKWHMLDLVTLETTSSAEMKKMIISHKADVYIVESSPAYFQMARELRTSLEEVRIKKEYQDINKRISATSDFNKTHFLLSESGMDNPVYNSFITEVLDYNGTDNIGASALLSGIAYNIIKLSE
ncbi:PBSX family phage terminase large subunit [Bacteroides caecigallinarum]|uniref:PBSX family phage terminase large subunit n=1 Tax=Bacteroides caecigallinarum TaxID=1411144 RepID=UPI001F430DF5|nr:PBSX family phage terminase large subunit [Bacteroides caecigallinarum]MCF2583211.1 PBSX family phage terminase large subunit [Bacteroides caecigallinarum]